MQPVNPLWVPVDTLQYALTNLLLCDSTFLSACVLTHTDTHIYIYIYVSVYILHADPLLSVPIDTLLYACLVTHFSVHMHFLEHVYWHPSLCMPSDLLLLCAHALPCACVPTPFSVCLLTPFSMQAYWHAFFCVPVNALLHARLLTGVSMHSQNPSAVHMMMCSLMPVFWHTSLCA